MEKKRLPQAMTGIVVVLFILLLSGCERTGYYEPGQQSVVDNLTDKSWERDYHVKLDNGEEFDVHEEWVFKDNTKGSCKNITTYADGTTRQVQTYFSWSFTIPDFSIIYLDYGLFWDIKELTAKKLHVCETYDDPVEFPGQTYRNFKEFAAVPVH